MPIVPAISVTQNTGTANQFTVTDISTGSDAGLTSRRLYLYKADNNTLVPSGVSTPYNEWAIAQPSLTLGVLDKDYALMFVTQWLTGAVITYSLTSYFVFTANTEVFLYNLGVTQISNPYIIQDTNYFSSKSQMWEWIDDADNAIAIGTDTKKAQLALDLARNYIINENIYF